MAALDAALQFVEAINAKDLARIRALMTPRHRFVDSLGAVVTGAEETERGWEAYFRMVPDYRIEVRESYLDGPVVVLLGTARGTYAPDGELRPEGQWETPGAWRAAVEGAGIAEWRVYADNEPIRQLMGGAST